MTRYASHQFYNQQMAKALAAPEIKRRRYATVPRAPISTDAGAVSSVVEKLLDAYQTKRAQDTDKLDMANALRMQTDRNAPQKEWDVEEYGSTPGTLRAATMPGAPTDGAPPPQGPVGTPIDPNQPFALGTDEEGDDANWMSEADHKKFYENQALKAQATFDQDNPYGMAAVNQGDYNLPGTTSLFGETTPGTEGPRTMAMKQALMGQQSVLDQEAEARGRTLEQTIATEKRAHKNELAILEYKRKNPAAAVLSGRPAAGIQLSDRYNQILKTPESEGGGQVAADFFLKNFANQPWMNVGDRMISRADAVSGKLNEGAVPINLAPSQTVKHQSEVSGAKEVAEGIGKLNVANFNRAQLAVSNVADIDDLTSRLQATDGSDLGFMAEIKQQRDKIFGFFGSKEALKKVSDTQIINSIMGAQVFSLIKALGIGARGLDTPAEREFMREVLTGSIELNKDTLLEMAAKRRKIQVRNVENWNKKLASGQLDNFYKSTGYLKEPIKSPGAAPVFKRLDISGDISNMSLEQLDKFINKPGTHSSKVLIEIHKRLQELGT